MSNPMTEAEQAVALELIKKVQNILADAPPSALTKFFVDRSYSCLDFVRITLALGENESLEFNLQTRKESK